MVRYAFLLFLTLLTGSAYAQNNTEYKAPKKLGISPGVIYNRQWAGELTFMYADYEMGPCNYAVAGPRVGAEFVFAGSQTVVAPKVGYQLAGMLLCLRASEVTYLHNNKVDIRVLPEVGVDFVTVANLCYGYNLHLFGDKFTDISDHRVTLTFNMYLATKKEKK